jgi:lipid-binding SYLF domain-containing protein
MKKIYLFLFVLGSVFLLNGFWSGKSVQQLRQERLKTSAQTLKLLYKYAPDARKMVHSAYGYATFSDLGVNVVIASFGGGKGVAHNNRTGENIYMNMGTAGLGLGLGVKDFRAIFIFENKKVFDYFVTHGWEANAQADAAAKLEKKGGALNGAISVAPGVRLYKLTQNGLALQVTIQGTKYWRDSDLN